jgi:hypothetical protein
MSNHFETVDLLFSSPPYFILRDYKVDGEKQTGKEETKEQYCDKITNLIKASIPTLKRSANVIINIGETYDNGVGYGIPQLLKTYIEQNTRLIYKDQLIWSKPNPKPQNESIKRPINNVEYLLWFVVDPKEAFYKMLTYTIGERDVKISHGAKDVDKDGKITTQGKAVDKVLVDGDEFFGTDPTVATRNLNASAIESVQVYEKKSDDVANSSTGEETQKILNLI